MPALIRSLLSQPFGTAIPQVLLRSLPIATLVCAAAGCRPPATKASVSTPEARSEVRFENVTATAGIDYRWPKGPRPLTILEAFGTGCAFLDFDGDGWQDVLLVTEPHPVLYRNLRNGRFEDVTVTSGLDRYRGAWKACGVGDYDGDGKQDLLLSGYRCLRLLRNTGSGGWSDTTGAAGLPPDNRKHWGSGSGFMDLDRDGDLDLVLLNYVQFGPKSRQYCDIPAGGPSGCSPRLYPPEFPELWENRGHGRLKDVTAASGLKDTTGTAQVLAFADVDDDGLMDFYIGNDGTPADLMRNLGRLRFENIGVSSGVAYGPANTALAAMGADWADYDRDGRLDFVVTAFSDESYALFRSTGPGTYENAAEAVGIAGHTLKSLGFGANFLDMDNDGWPDLAFANGHVHAEVARADPELSFRQPIMLFRNEQGSAFRDLVPGGPEELRTPIFGRGSASGDFDNDGRVDWLAVDYEGAPLLLRNVSEGGGHWLKLDLRAGGRNRFAYGSRITARNGAQQWVSQVSPACSYLSSSDPRPHLGLGAVTKLDSLTIRWPDGSEQTLRDVAADRILTVLQGEPVEAPAGNPDP